MLFPLRIGMQVELVVGKGIDFCLAERIGWVVGLGEEERRRDGAASRDDGLVAGKQGSK